MHDVILLQEYDDDRDHRINRIVYGPIPDVWSVSPPGWVQVQWVHGPSGVHRGLAINDIINIKSFTTRT